MKFAVSAIFALAAVVLAQPKLTNTEFNVVEGEPFEITWMNAEGPVTLTLKNGDAKNLKDVTVIQTGITGDSFTWIPSDLPSDTYAIEISDASGVPNYSIQFEYEGTGVAPSASSSAPASSTVTSTVTSEASSSAPSSTPSSESSTESSMTTSTTSTSTRSAPTSTPTNQNSEGQRFSSPLALLLVTVAAVMLFN
ncbi:hypothetical protein V8F33_007748 [Rhypophila sp. PSN 637]